jgi:gamma-glutamylcyclotransferase (GGCT)/AIG2-like uncharacterized protein YtfP
MDWRIFVDITPGICHHIAMETKLLFVYGTLMQGMRNHIYLEKAKFLGTAQTKPEYELLYNGSIPAVKAGHEVVRGELYEVDDAILASLDVLEEVNSKLYDRQEIDIDGKKAVAYLGSNIFNFDTWEHVPDGDFRRLIEGQQKTP